MSSTSSVVQRFFVLADHGQFFLQDLDAHGIWMRAHGTDPALVPAGWTQEADQIHRIGIEPHSIALGTARSDVVEAMVCVHLTAPVADLEDAEHVVEADLGLPNGDLAVYGPADDVGTERRIQVGPGRYRTRVSYLPADAPEAGSNDAEPGEHFLYRIEMWPAGEPTGLVVVKQGPSPWAG
ncbi:hypothetical protein [Actinomadura litoris]|uniref:hypothetical protein n=1 Tax=Actinomadura litoris TaxID=2678616 RepID=UPI001FA7EB14|nr:hypothetical protein [Actinomadura litoris]